MREPGFWSGDSGSAQVLAAFLSPLAALYGLGVTINRLRARPMRPRAKVLCIGNLTVGGTGKTPTAIALARLLSARGMKVAFLTRGYGGRLAGPLWIEPTHHQAGDVGDEPLLLARMAPTVLARDRAAGAKLADDSGADVVVMDDGFQNFALTKTLSIVVVDAETGFGNGHLLPAGPLRETVSGGLARTDAVIVMGEGDPALPSFAGPVLRARLVPNNVEALQGRKVFAFAGIGRPEKFFATLRKIGAVLSGTKGFADHHIYTRSELSRLRAMAEQQGALLVTTEKDYVRIAPDERHAIVAVQVQTHFEDDIALCRLLDRLRSETDGSAR